MSIPATILFLNGPNLNMLGIREPEIYGYTSLASIESAVKAKAAALNLEIDFRQSNSESELVTWIQQAYKKVAGVVINPAAYTHTSVAIADALRLHTCPIIEYHINNPHQKAERAFRAKSYVNPVATAIMIGLGASGYTVAIEAMHSLLQARKVE